MGSIENSSPSESPFYALEEDIRKKRRDKKEKDERVGKLKHRGEFMIFLFFVLLFSVFFLLFLVVFHAYSCSIFLAERCRYI